jgi:hypothetical protein
MRYREAYRKRSVSGFSPHTIANTGRNRENKKRREVSEMLYRGSSPYKTVAQPEVNDEKEKHPLKIDR